MGRHLADPRKKSPLMDSVGARAPIRQAPLTVGESSDFLPIFQTVSLLP